MEYTPFSLLVDVGWISFLMVVGNVLRRRVKLFQALLLPSPITAGLLGLLLGPHVLNLLGFSDRMGDYTTILIAVVFAAMPYSMQFDRSVRSGAKAMWSYSTGMFLGQWGLFILLGVFLFKPIWGTEDWFGMMLPVGYVGGFGTAAAVGSSLEATGAVGASSLGFTSATVGTLAAIVGGIIFANWAIRTERTASMPKKLPWEILSGYIDEEENRPSIGKATTNPSAIEPIALHAGILTLTVMVAYLFNGWLKGIFPSVSPPLFAVAFVMGILGKTLLNLLGKPNYVDRDTINSISGAATDYLIAFGTASIVPAAIASYWVPLVIMFILGTIYCVVFLFFVAPTFFGKQWIERAIFGWGWATAAVATGIALLKIVDPKLKSGTLNEYGVAYVGFAPFEIGMTIIAPIAVIAGWTLGLGLVTTVAAVVILGAALVLKWVPGRKKLVATQYEPLQE
ncbi:sodium/glutamate symporter [Corynebacterium uberis]|uniref:sodium/glutamate symporter n=1 Tax=Corynebacterium TaxID=1716 RepID=UPI001D0B2B52|nr:sodium:glutamate symporter [Corynebacterium uberis]MCZ9309670.1 sodium:glutamate symporter [Corynebacterium sp. c6VSa_13]UDL73474.1 sodium:glutamate symporter [Corynebacterium uberis]UDL75646.1 sodium:glutamate symporter [Corynebacterium uberis]UDL77859.1 sodium:glutamate symporter [Corynebacterium uberis]UDL80142.1 sodium:glutamate symporter [Corynebacterium uberis]